jgi:hypothetical protein
MVTARSQGLLRKKSRVRVSTKAHADKLVGNAMNTACDHVRVACEAQATLSPLLATSGLLKFPLFRTHAPKALKSVV